MGNLSFVSLVGLADGSWIMGIIRSSKYSKYLKCSRVKVGGTKAPQDQPTAAAHESKQRDEGTAETV